MTLRSPRPLTLATLLDQQLWFIGHDIRHADGNALTRYGFDRWRSPAVGTSCYRLCGDDPSRQVVCWGFGIYVGPVTDGSEQTAAYPRGYAPLQRGVFIQRHSFTPPPIGAPAPAPCASAQRSSRTPIPYFSRRLG